ncbi:uncharacterized protein LOC141575001 [Camelus bactrianus]|uniref:Uncharacterized protein LOC141575001 n=1 Tax=Camelus bactrianus TaxID=9837 RepID=A0AC58PG79_CAMBA
MSNALQPKGIEESQERSDKTRSSPFRLRGQREGFGLPARRAPAQAHEASGRAPWRLGGAVRGRGRRRGVALVTGGRAPSAHWAGGRGGGGQAATRPRRRRQRRRPQGREQRARGVRVEMRGCGGAARAQPAVVGGGSSQPRRAREAYTRPCPVAQHIHPPKIQSQAFDRKWRSIVSVSEEKEEMEPGKHSHRRERQSQDGSAQGLATLPAGPPGSLVSGLCDSSVPSASMLVDSACAFLGLTWDSPRCYCAQPSVVLARVLAAEGRVPVAEQLLDAQSASPACWRASSSTVQHRPAPSSPVQLHPGGTAPLPWLSPRHHMGCCLYTHLGCRRGAGRRDTHRMGCCGDLRCCSAHSR